MEGTLFRKGPPLPPQGWGDTSCQGWEITTGEAARHLRRAGGQWSPRVAGQGFLGTLFSPGQVD